MNAVEIRKLHDTIAPRVPENLVVHIRHPYNRQELPSPADYEKAKLSITRHVDDIEQVFIITHPECRHCGLDPEFDDSGPFCCGPAVEEYHKLIDEAKK